MLSQIAKTRPDPPFLIASTLLVPGYVDQDEVSKIANFISSLDKEIPYALLGFHPQFLMTDLPTTSRRHADQCKLAAERAGLCNVRIGNIHLLGNDYWPVELELILSTCGKSLLSPNDLREH
jgi:pyruvate formate lyase activating enzyme